jgi:hypothetical protein
MFMKEVETNIMMLHFVAGTLLTSVLLMQAIDRQKYQDDTFAKLSQLIHVDPHRGGYFKDLR